jgi:isoquinoline 1-oxidoreductase
MTATIDMTRRTFIKAVGGGVVILVSLGPSALVSAQGRRGYPTDINAYLRVGEDGRVTVFSGKIEMGQGVLTSQAQMIADELGVTLDAIDMILGDTDQCPWDAGTWGSLTTRMFGPSLRAAGAEARLVLTQLAAEHLGVPRESLEVDGGVVFVKGDRSRSVSYATLAKGKEITRTLDEKAVLRSVAEFSVMGTSPVRLDATDKVTGAAKYAGDVRLPGLLYARLLRPPAHGAKLRSVDTDAAAKMPGTKVVNQDGMVAVLHETPDGAEEALSRVEAKWDVPSHDVDQDSIFDWLMKSAPSPNTRDDRGDVATAISSAEKVYQRTYTTGYRAHSPMEPHTSVAELKNGKMTIWASTQSPFGTRDAIARELEMDPGNVRVITPYVGGGFGGKSAGRQSSEAARLARIAGRPVMVAWTRQEEFFYDTFDPASIVKISSALGADGKLTAWDYDVYFAGSRSAEIYYDIPNARLREHGSWRGAGSDAHLWSVGPWRAPGANTNVFARESHLDIMAADAGIDPVEFRLKNMSDERMLRVVKAAAEAFGWKPSPGPSGRGVGIACGIDAGTYVALAAKVAVDRTSGEIRVERVVCAQDMGIVVSPVGATMQVEGCITMGLGYVLSEELHFKGAEILDTNFGTYSLPKFSWVPKIETVLVKNDDLAPQGGGEPAIVPMGAVVANAVFDATGVRLDRLPMTKERVKQALKESKDG